MAENYPQLAVRIVTDLAGWQKWGLADAVAMIVDAPPAKLDRADLRQLRAYLRAAEAQVPSEDLDAGSGSGTLVIILGLVVLALVAVDLGYMKRRPGI